MGHGPRGGGDRTAETINDIVPVRRVAWKNYNKIKNTPVEIKIQHKIPMKTQRRNYVRKRRFSVGKAVGADGEPAVPRADENRYSG